MIEHIFESHAHYNSERFDEDRHEVLARLPQQGVEYIVNIGADMQTSCESIQLAEQYPYVYCSIGVHPQDAPSFTDEDLKTLRQMSQHPKCVAIGEIGLDYYYGSDTKEQQLTAFEQQLILAKELDMPVIIHSRDAVEDTLRLLKKYHPHGVVHCFTGSAETAKELQKLGLYIGFTGVVTFKNARRSVEAAAEVALDRLLCETDCPYMAPEPHRGKRCDSSMLVQILEKLAEIKGVDPQELAEITNQNAKRVFRLDSLHHNE